MNKGLYFWKSGLTPNKRQWIILTIIVAIVLASVSGWYYMVYVPHKKHEEEVLRKKNELQQNVKKVNSFYEEQLKGGSLERFSLLLNEIYRSRTLLAMTGYDEKVITCKNNSCNFNYEILKSHVFNVQKKNFWGKDYSASFSNKGINFSGIPAKLESNSILDSYKRGKDVSIADCGELLSYIYAFNSINDKSDQLVIAKAPASSVLDVEEKIKGNNKYYGLLFGTWSMNAKNDVIHVMSIFQRQALKNSFIVKGIELKSKALKISGGFVCKSGK